MNAVELSAWAHAWEAADVATLDRLEGRTHADEEARS